MVVAQIVTATGAARITFGRAVIQTAAGPEEQLNDQVGRIRRSAGNREVEMSISTRREFVRSSAVAAAGVTVVGGLVAVDAEAATAHHDGGPVVAYVRDARKGEISVMAGDRTINVRDRQLAARLVRATR
jgi:hypothetical protein